MLWGREPKESKLSRESSLLCPPPPPTPPPPLRWWSSSRSEYQLSSKPLSLTLLPFWLNVSCRAFHIDTKTHTQSDNRVPITTFSSTVCVVRERSPRWSEKSVLSSLSFLLSTYTPIMSIRDACCNLNEITSMFSIHSHLCHNKNNPSTLMTVFTVLRDNDIAHKHVSKPPEPL